MNINIFRNLLLFLGLLLVQALVLNHIHLFGYATPLLYVYFVLRTKRNCPKWELLLWSFCMGLAADTLTNTPGVAAASMTFIGLLQPYVLSAFLNRESAEDLRPTLQTLGFARYLYYASILLLVYCLLFFTLEAFSFFIWADWLLNIVGSFVLTLLLILVIENLRSGN